MTVNTAGEYEAVDCLKSTGSGAQRLGLSARDTPVSALLRHPAIEVRQQGVAQLAPKCVSCKHQAACAGGYYPHRFSADMGFMNPSVYCADLYWLLDEITAHVKSLVPNARKTASAGTAAPSA
ncbi:SAM_SPASM_FxsB: radical SAM/SPASM domain, FxsB family [Xylophilus ampelinus]|nr:SAM_SPASM_FxsB: radical SAM/SPASM domain, FxsB family [Xylophilus ampelinus]